MLESYNLVSLLYHFHRDIACAQVRGAHTAIFNIYFIELVFGNFINVANSQGHDVESLYESNQMARISTHLSFGKNKNETIADLAVSSNGVIVLM